MTNADAGASAKTQSRRDDTFLKVAFALLALGLCGMVLALVYITMLKRKAIAAAALCRHMKSKILLRISLAQRVIFLGVAVFTALWAGAEARS